MQKFVERMIDEKKVVDERLEKLEAFLMTDTYNGLSQKERKLLKEQAEAMTNYSRILGERIAIYS